MYAFPIGILEDGMLQSWKSKPISSFGDLMAENDYRSMLLTNVFRFISNTVKDILHKMVKLYLTNPISKFWYDYI